MHMITVEQVDQYIARLNAHDWWYEMSDDHQVWGNSRNEHYRLAHMAKDHEVFAQLFKLASTYHYQTNKTTETKKQYNIDVASIRDSVVSMNKQLQLKAA